MRPTCPRRSALLPLKMVRRSLKALADGSITPQPHPPARLCKRLKRERAWKG
jgi:hypothetical protein